MAAPYVGNQDYRGYLNYLAQGGDKTAQTLIGSGGSLGVVNNQGQITGGAGVLAPSILNANQNYYKTFQTMGSGGSSVVQPGYTYSAPAPVYAPKLDVAAINSQARSAAEGAVNPYYTKTLNDFLTSQAQQKEFQQRQTDTNISNLEDVLKQTTEQNAITGQRTSEDVATNLAKVARSEDQFQTDSGTAFDKSRIDLAKKNSVSGLTGGLAAQSQEENQNKNITDETRQGQQFQDQKDQQNLFKTRTFEDLSRSTEQATGSKEKGVTQAKFDLEKYLQTAADTEASTRNSLEKDRLDSIAAEQKNQASLLFNQYLSKISNPAQYVAAINTYGGQF